MKKIFLMVVLALLLAVPAYADIAFVNGGFENGNLDGWTLYSQTYGGTTYGPQSGTGLTSWSPGTNGGVSSAVMNVGADPIVGINKTYNGNNSGRVGDSTAWGYSGGGNIYNWIQQSATVTGTASGHLYFAWAAVLEISGHSYSSTPYFNVTVTNDTQGTNIYNYLRYEQDAGFWTTSGWWKYSTGNNPLYPGWYVEDLDLAALGVNVGDTLTLKALARDCTPSAHAMYVYLDGFGGQPPPPPGVIPEPSTFLLLGAGLVGAGLLRKRLKS